MKEIDFAYVNIEVFALFPNCLISLMYIPFQCYRKGLENGKHVLCEYPLALSLKVAKEFFEMAGRKGWYQFMNLFVNFAVFKFILLIYLYN